MLKIKHSHSINLPRISLSKPMVVFSPVVQDNNEGCDYEKEHDNAWELTERPDAEQLEEFWSRVEDDVRKDPEWFAFCDD